MSRSVRPKLYEYSWVSGSGKYAPVSQNKLPMKTSVKYAPVSQNKLPMKTSVKYAPVSQNQLPMTTPRKTKLAIGYFGPVKYENSYVSETFDLLIHNSYGGFISKIIKPKNFPHLNTLVLTSEPEDKYSIDQWIDYFIRTKNLPGLYITPTIYSKYHKDLKNLEETSILTQQEVDYINSYAHEQANVHGFNHYKETRIEV